MFFAIVTERFGALSMRTLDEQPHLISLIIPSLSRLNNGSGGITGGERERGGEISGQGGSDSWLPNNFTGKTIS